jgi:exopolysaccharide biosynthesis polyprenyl glycosylphosphotransferase
MFFRRRISLRGLSLLLLDLLLIAAAVFAAHVVYHCAVEESWTTGYAQAQLWFLERIPTLIGAMTVHAVVNFAAGLYEPSIIASGRRTALVALLAVALASAFIVLLFYAKLKLHYGRSILSLAGGFTWVFLLLTRWFYRRVVGGGYFSRPTLLVGEGEEAETVLRLLRRDENASYQVFGIVRSTAQSVQGGPAFVQGVPVLGDLENLEEFVRAYRIQAILLTTSLSRERELLQRLRPLRYAGVALLDYVSLHEQLAHSIPLDHIDDEWLLLASSQGSALHIRKLKRVLDVTVALVGLLLSAPLALLAALCIRLDTPGPVLFRQCRTGQNGQRFTLLKLRTMRVDAEVSTGAVWADKFDRRITRVGRFLRATRIDEIPQLVNVLRGEMSLVGPRPERPEFVATLTAQIPFYQERLLVPPGLTGWAQIQYPYAASVEAARMKLQYDLYYIKHLSLVLDLAILLKTAKTILVGLRHSADETNPPSRPALGEDPGPALRVLTGSEAKDNSRTA